jgi:aminopeptidase N
MKDWTGEAGYPVIDVLEQKNNLKISQSRYYSSPISAKNSDTKKAEEIERFFKENPSIGLERTISQVTEQIRSNAMWLKRDRKSLEYFLQNLTF